MDLVEGSRSFLNIMNIWFSLFKYDSLGSPRTETLCHADISFSCMFSLLFFSFISWPTRRTHSTHNMLLVIHDGCRFRCLCFLFSFVMMFVLKSVSVSHINLTEPLRQISC